MKQEKEVLFQRIRENVTPEEMAEYERTGDSSLIIEDYDKSSWVLLITYLPEDENSDPEKSWELFTGKRSVIKFLLDNRDVVDYNATIVMGNGAIKECRDIKTGKVIDKKGITVEESDTAFYFLEFMMNFRNVDIPFNLYDYSPEDYVPKYAQPEQ